MFSRDCSEKTLYRVCFYVNLVLTAVFAIVVYESSFTFGWGASSERILTISALLAFSLAARVLFSNRAVPRLPLALALQSWAATLVAATTTVALSWRRNLVDEHLLSLDAFLGFDAMSFAANVGSTPYAGDALWVVYRATGIIILAQTCFFALTENGRRVAEVTFLTVMTIVGCGIVGLFMPAEGPLAYLHMPRAIADTLPEYSGVYYMELFNAYRFSRVSTIDFDQLNGVITFPSWHVCLAMIMYHVMSDKRSLKLPFAILAVLTVISAFPIGGHYFSDAIGGALIFIGSLSVIHLIDARRLGPGGGRPTCGALLERLDFSAIARLCKPALEMASILTPQRSPSPRPRRDASI